MANISLDSESQTPGQRRAVAIWLLVCAGLVFSMVVLGGVTRLTHSGLSMVEWRPVTGWMPPAGEVEWQSAFENYRQFPEYQKLNLGMTLADFKSIFWFEFLHRLLGRLIGVVFLVPLMVFWALGHLSRDLRPKLAAIYVLGGLQGALGWYMVTSGLVEHPDVSQYRLTAHLALAVMILGWMMWVVMGLLEPSPPAFNESRRTVLRSAGLATLVLVVVTILAGGFVAGADAGFAYNTFPLMGDRFFPEDYWMMDPPLVNLFENVVAIQFNHRILGILVFLATLGLWLHARQVDLPARLERAFALLAAAGTVQLALGVATLVLFAPVAVAVAHQGGSLVVLAATLWALHGLKRSGR